MMETLENANPLLSVRQTFAGVSYLIPDYQRGYKWTVVEVLKLLEDVAGFERQAGREYYCLQNLTLVRSCNEQRIKVVDGQQRLTTSAVVISYLQWACQAKYADIKLDFGERKKNTTQHFLTGKILNGQLWEDIAAVKKEETVDVVGNKVWLDPHPKNLPEELHKVFDSDELKKRFTGFDYNHSDIFHLFCAAMTVAAFLRNLAKTKLVEFAVKFLDEVRFLHNVIEEPNRGDGAQSGSSGIEAEIFSKVNGFRVPLDGADLLRAIFITNVAREKAPTGEIEREVWLNEVRVKLGLELDQMNAWWHEPRHQRYFKMFDNVSDPMQSFDVDRYPINLLYKLFVASEGGRPIYLDRFERPTEGGVAELYAKVKRFHSEMKDWFDDVSFYHLAGFLAGQCGMSFKNLYDLHQATHSRNELKRKLKRLVFFHVTQTDGREKRVDFEKLDEKIKKERFDALAAAIDGTTPHDWYAEETYSVKKLLVLMDVIAFTEPLLVLDDKEKSEQKNIDKGKKRTPLADHLDPEFFRCKDDDKEHIFPQTPIGSEVLKDWRLLEKKIGEYWRLIVATAGKGMSKDDEEKKKLEGKLLKEWGDFWVEQEKFAKVSDTPFPINAFSEVWFKWLLEDDANFVKTKGRLNQFVFEKCQIDINSIGNIVMLDFAINRKRSYSNSHYTEKRSQILQCYRQQQPVRLHTYRVFVKEFSDRSSLDVWGNDSIVANRNAIKNVLSEYFADMLVTKEVEANG